MSQSVSETHFHVFCQRVQNLLVGGFHGRELVYVEELLVLQVDVCEGGHSSDWAEEVLLKDGGDGRLAELVLHRVRLHVDVRFKLAKAK